MATSKILTKVESLNNSIRFIKKCGEAIGINITEEDMAQQLNISIKQFNNFINTGIRIPDNLIYQLYIAYDHIIKAQEMEGISMTIRQMIAIIKERGAAEGIEITDEAMAIKINIPIEQFGNYIKGEIETPQEILEMLWSKYKDVLKNIQIHRVTHITHETVAWPIKSLNKSTKKLISSKTFSFKFSIL